MNIPEFTLQNGTSIPAIGFGTYKLVGESGIATLRAAIDFGFRHFDTASYYGNEADVASAIAESNVSRQEVRITTKVWRTDLGYDAALRSIDQSLQQLRTDYLDFVLIHWPANAQTAEDWEKLNRLTWKALEAAYEEKIVRSIGLSNFWEKQLESLVTKANICPVLNQTEIHPGFYQEALIAKCQQYGIHNQAWSPLARGRIFDLPLMVQLSEKYQKTPAQIALRWLYQLGISSIPKCSHQARMVENTQIFDFQLTSEEVESIAALPLTGFSGEDPDAWK